LSLLHKAEKGGGSVCQEIGQRIRPVNSVGFAVLCAALENDSPNTRYFAAYSLGIMAKEGIDTLVAVPALEKAKLDKTKVGKDSIGKIATATLALAGKESEADKKKKAASARKYYQQARMKWTEAIELSVYDNPRVIKAIAPLLDKALGVDPNHIGSLVMFADLCAAMSNYAKATGMARRAAELEPANGEATALLRLLSLPDDGTKRDEVMSHLEARWNSSDW
jgi:hypothetical protein